MNECIWKVFTGLHFYRLVLILRGTHVNIFSRQSISGTNEQENKTTKVHWQQQKNHVGPHERLSTTFSNNNGAPAEAQASTA